MSWLTNTFGSSLGKKLLVAITGLFLCSFLVIHLIGNFQLLYSDNGEAFNMYAITMTTNPFIKVVSKVLYASIILHAVVALGLVIKNKQARPVGYKKVNNQSAWTSRYMGVLGTIILVFIAAHMSDFWWEYHYEELPMQTYTIDGEDVTVKDLYKEVEEAYENPLLVLFYVVSMGVLAFHLWHGFQSGFQTLGLNHPKYTPFIRTFGVFFAILIPIGFAIIPIYFMIR